MRTREGLPFVCTKYMKLLLESIIARVQRDSKVTLCHILWMGNHPHIIIVAKDKKACTQFYGEIQKQLTEAVKRLLGLKHLNLWNNNATSVIPYHDIETVCYRIAYLYANPARANLVQTVSRYPGLSSWREFQADKANIDARHSKQCPWIRSPYIESLQHPTVSEFNDYRLCNKWRRKAKHSHELVIEPNAWMKTFGIDTGAEVEETNERIMAFHTVLEEEAREKRVADKRKVMGRKKLRSRPINLSYQPKKTSRRIFTYSLDPKLRVYLIEAYQEFCANCRECYERWKLGDFSVQWPPGAFLPPMPHVKNEIYQPIDYT